MSPQLQFNSKVGVGMVGRWGSVGRWSEWEGSIVKGIDCLHASETVLASVEHSWSDRERDSLTGEETSVHQFSRLLEGATHTYCSTQTSLGGSTWIILL